jgi:aminopeptidase 2
MCKLRGDRDLAEGGLDITKGREILPANVIAKHYDLTLEPDFKKLTYEGTVVIDLEVAEDSKTISLNTLELDIHSTRILSRETTIRSVTGEHGHSQI